jgi:phage shock protein A
MGIFERIRRLFRANMNNALRRAEDPEKMLTQLLDDMNRQLIESKRNVAAAIADEKRLERQVEAQRNNAAEWERKAIVALRAGQEDLARQALIQKQKEDAHAEQMAQQWEKQHAAVENLKTALRGLQQKIDDAQRRKNLLVARAKRAEAQRKIQEIVTGLGDSSAFDAFDEMAQRVDQIEAENEALEQLDNVQQEQDLEAKIAALEQPDPNDMIEDLRKRIALDDARTDSSISSTGAGTDSVDVTIEELKKFIKGESTAESE